MLKKTVSVLLIIVMVCSLCACQTDSTKPVPTVTVSPDNTKNEMENGNETAITVAGFDVNNVKNGDKISVFTVASSDVKKSENGTLASAVIKFTGSLAVKGSYTVDAERKVVSFIALDEYTKYIPYPADAMSKLENIGMDTEKFSAIYGDSKSGYAAVVIESLTLVYSAENGEWTAFVDDFSKDENEYAVMQ